MERLAVDSNFREKNNSQILIYQTEGGKTKMNVSKKKTLRHIKELIKTGEGYHFEGNGSTFDPC